MTQLLKQLTAGTVMIGPFVDDADGNTVEDALTISQADVLLSKNGAAFAQTSGTADLVYGTIGYYAWLYGTADTDTLGSLKLAVHESGALPVWHDFTVTPANTWDSLIGGTDYLDVTAQGTVTATGSVTVTGGTVDVATAVTNAVTVSGGTVAAVTGTVTASLAARTVEGSIDELEAWKLALAALVGKTSGGGTNTLVFRDTGDSVDRITATVDGDKNRTALTLNVT